MTDYSFPVDPSSAERLFCDNEPEFFITLAIRYNLDIYVSADPRLNNSPCIEIPYRFFKLEEKCTIGIDNPRKPLRPVLVKVQGARDVAYYVLKRFAVTSPANFQKGAQDTTFRRFLWEIDCYCRMRGHSSILNIRGIYRDTDFNGNIRYGIVIDYMRHGDGHNVLEALLTNSRYRDDSGDDSDHIFPKYEEQYKELLLALVLQVSEQVAIGIEGMHTHGFLNRDLKLHNLLFDENYNIKIFDFDLAINLQRIPDYLRGYYLGTAGFAPEYSTVDQWPTTVDEWKKEDVFIYGRFIVELVTKIFVDPLYYYDIFTKTYLHHMRSCVNAKDSWTLQQLAEQLEPNTCGPLSKLLSLADQCCWRARGKRPTMAQVIEEIRRIRMDFPKNGFTAETAKAIFNYTPQSHHNLVVNGIIRISSEDSMPWEALANRMPVISRMPYYKVDYQNKEGGRRLRPIRQATNLFNFRELVAIQNLLEEYHQHSRHTSLGRLQSICFPNQKSFRMFVDYVVAMCDRDDTYLMVALRRMVEIRIAQGPPEMVLYKSAHPPLLQLGPSLARFASFMVHEGQNILLQYPSLSLQSSPQPTNCTSVFSLPSTTGFMCLTNSEDESEEDIQSSSFHRAYIPEVFPKNSSVSTQSVQKRYQLDSKGSGKLEHQPENMVWEKKLRFSQGFDDTFIGVIANGEAEISIKMESMEIEDEEGIFVLTGVDCEDLESSKTSNHKFDKGKNIECGVIENTNILSARAPNSKSIAFSQHSDALSIHELIVQPSQHEQAIVHSISPSLQNSYKEAFGMITHAFLDLSRTNPQFANSRVSEVGYLVNVIEAMGNESHTQRVDKKSGKLRKKTCMPKIILGKAGDMTRKFIALIRRNEKDLLRK